VIVCNLNNDSGSGWTNGSSLAPSNTIESGRPGRLNLGFCYYRSHSFGGEETWKQCANPGRNARVTLSLELCLGSAKGTTFRSLSPNGEISKSCLNNARSILISRAAPSRSRATNRIISLLHKIGGGCRCAITIEMGHSA
jgi:hypothetical protein